MSSLNVEWNGNGGQVKVPGLGAVLATIDRWTLKSRGENRRDRPMWDLRGSLSYVNQTLYKTLVENGYAISILLTVRDKTYIADFDKTNVELTEHEINVKEIILDVR